MYAGVDIGGTNTQIGVIDTNGRVVDHERLSTGKYEEARDLVVTIAYTLLRMAKVGQFKIDGIGVGCPNVNPATGVLEQAANLHFKEKTISLKDEFRKYFPTAELAFDNDANAAALGEMVYGKAKGIKDYMFVTLGTGVGGGIIADGRLVYGLNGMAGEIGHILVESSDGGGLSGGPARLCGCGRKGCLEQYAGANGIFKTYLEICAQANVPPQAENYRNVADLARNGDALALATYDITGRILGRALANLACVTAPTHIFIFGGVAKVGSILIEPTRKYFYENLLFCYGKDIRIEMSGLMDSENDAAILGAAALVHRG